jgi:uncharacterized protein DUF4189
MHRGASWVLAAAVLVAALLIGWGGAARADGALAVGSTGDVVKYGVAFGMVVNLPKEQAAAKALEHCRTFKAREAAERCRLVATFSKGECFAVALDPKSGTPGAGWAVGPDQATANAKATAMCEASAGSDRKGSCRVASAGCDTSGPAGSKEDTQEAPPEDGSDWRERFRSPASEEAGWDIPLPVLLLLAVAIAGVGYILARTLKGGAAPAGAAATSAKSKVPPAKPAKSGKGKGKRAS